MAPLFEKEIILKTITRRCKNGIKRMDVTKIKEINRNEKSSRIAYTSIYDIPILSSDIRLI